MNLDGVTSQQTVSGAELLSVPFPSSNSLKNALRIMPGVVQDAKAGVHLNGGTEEQMLFTLNGFTLNDPLTGRFESRVSVESVQSVEVVDGRLPAEFGRGSAGMVAVTTTPGDDRPRYSATNFFPGIESSKGLFLGNWSPRLGFSGPLVKGRAWFSDSVTAQYDQQVLMELPAGADRMSSWRVGNLLHTQVNLTPSQILYTGLLVNGWSAPRTGLNILTPPEATVDRRSRQWFFHVKDQICFWRGALIEFGFSANRTFGREIPQGHAFLRLQPDGSAGNAYVDALRRAGRDQWLASLVTPSFTWMGEHRIKAGADAGRLNYRQFASRTGVEQFRGDGTLASRIVFAGLGELTRSDLEASLFAQDSWRFKHGILAELGVRSGWDGILRTWNVAPRVGLAWMPHGLTGTRIHAAYAVVFEAANLRLLTRPLDQYSLTTYFSGDGTVLRGPSVSAFALGPWPLSTPRARNWSAGLERELADNTALRVNYRHRRGDRGFTYTNQLGPGQIPSGDMVQRFGASEFDALYMLGNSRHDVFDSLEIAARQTLRKQYGWLASYTRSRTLSNAVLDIDVSDPTIVLRNSGPMPWDTPHRFVGWTYLPLFWKDWAVAGMLETRTGFPFSIQNNGRVIGDVNTRRYPAFFELNLHIERRFVLRGHRWEARMGFNNLTGHDNPNVVNANTDSQHFLQYYGGQGRTLNFRIRWLGRAGR